MNTNQDNQLNSKSQQVASAPDLQVAPANPNIVINTEPKKTLPIWFYLLFAIVAIAFFFVTFLLAKSLIEKNKSEIKDNSVAQIITPTLLPTATSAPKLTPTPTDEYISTLEVQSDSDELSQIETDVSNTDIGELKTDLNKFETSLNP